MPSKRRSQISDKRSTPWSSAMGTFVEVERKTVSKQYLYTAVHLKRYSPCVMYSTYQISRPLATSSRWATAICKSYANDDHVRMFTYFSAARASPAVTLVCSRFLCVFALFAIKFVVAVDNFGVNFNLGCVLRDGRTRKR